MLSKPNSIESKLELNTAHTAIVHTPDVEFEAKGCFTDDFPRAPASSYSYLYPQLLSQFRNQQEGDTPATPDWILASAGAAPPAGGGLDWLTQAAQPDSAALGQIYER